MLGRSLAISGQGLFGSRGFRGDGGRFKGAKLLQRGAFFDLLPHRNGLPDKGVKADAVGCAAAVRSEHRELPVGGVHQQEIVGRRRPGKTQVFGLAHKASGEALTTVKI